MHLSVIGLGGHEFLPDGTVKAMGEEFHRAVTPGVIWDGFGGKKRCRMLQMACDAGVNFFDVTMDSEKEALGRNLAEISPQRPVFIQTRPEGMVYNNDPADEDKTKVLDYELLKAETQRAIGLLDREQIDIYNFGLFPPAVERQPGYVARLAENVERLKQDGLIRFACVDTLSGEGISLEMIATDAFDAVFTNLSIVGDAPLERVIPAAQERGMAILAREAFLKGRFFTLGEAAGIRDRAKLARAGIRWILAQDVVTSLVLGVADPEQLSDNLTSAEQPAPTDEDKAMLDALQATPEFAEARKGQHAFFRQGWG
jgi:aryl-alcohol dehydrogenase-like predicted oxidoreductase